MRISGSILAVPDNRMYYAMQLKYAHVDCIHIDIFKNGEFDIKELMNFDDSYPPLDVHLIYNRITDDDIDVLNSAGVSYVNIQFENLQDKDAILDLSRRLKPSFGLAFTSNTSLDVIEHYVQVCNQIMFMCSEPGVSGAVFDEKNFDRIRLFHDAHPEITIVADGGIDSQRAEFMVGLGVSMIVSGSYLCKGYEQLGINAYSLKYTDAHEVKAKNKMVPIASLPLVQTSDTFETIINVMNRFKLGLDFVIDKGQLMGVIADGDIRRGFIKFGKGIFDKAAADLMNSNPYTISGEKTIKEVYDDISKIHKGIDVIPIVDGDILMGGLNLRMGT